MTDLNRGGAYTWFRVWMPYQYVKLHKEPGHTYLPVNRNYEPLGSATGQWTKWDDFAYQAVRFARHPHTFKDVWINNRLYLYDDGLKISEYFKRLEKLMRYQAKSPYDCS